MLNIQSTARTMSYIFDKDQNVLALLASRKKVKTSVRTYMCHRFIALILCKILDRKPVDPPPIIQLKIRDDSDPAQYVIIGTYLMQVLTGEIQKLSPKSLLLHVHQSLQFST